jgi:hypothetical protein
MSGGVQLIWHFQLFFDILIYFSTFSVIFSTFCLSTFWPSAFWISASNRSTINLAFCCCLTVELFSTDRHWHGNTEWNKGKITKQKTKGQKDKKSFSGSRSISSFRRNVQSYCKKKSVNWGPGTPTKRDARTKLENFSGKWLRMVFLSANNEPCKRGHTYIEVKI